MTNRSMRRTDRALSEGEAFAIFNKADYLTVSTTDADGTPYGVPVSFVLMDGQLYFHATNEGGHKQDNFQHDARVCATAVVDVEALYVDDFTTRYSSAMMFGRIRCVEDAVEARKALVALCMKYLPEHKSDIGAAMKQDWPHTTVWAIAPTSITGKAAHRV